MEPCSQRQLVEVRKGVAPDVQKITKMIVRIPLDLLWHPEGDILDHGCVHTADAVSEVTNKRRREAPYVVGDKKVLAVQYLDCLGIHLLAGQQHTDSSIFTDGETILEAFLREAISSSMSWVGLFCHGEGEEYIG